MAGEKKITDEWLLENCPSKAKLRLVIEVVDGNGILSITLSRKLFDPRKLLKVFKKEFPNKNVRLDGHGVVVGSAAYEKKPDFHVIGERQITVSKNANGKKILGILCGKLIG